MPSMPLDESEPSLHFVHPGSIEQATGGSIYDRRMIEELRRNGWTVALHELDGQFPISEASTRDAAAALLDAMPDGAQVVIDGLALPAFAAPLPRHEARLRAVALVHHPTADETGLDARTRHALLTVERDLLQRMRHVLVPSAAMARRVAAYDVARERVTVVTPGTDPAPRATGSNGEVPNLISVAALIPRKGHERLIAALVACRDLAWRLTCVGPADRDPETAARVVRAIDANGLADRITLAGELRGPPLEALYRTADVFVLASEYEGYGMAFAEAMARGLPVVASGDGAVRDTVPEAAGTVVPVGAPAELADALRRMIADPAYRRFKADGARRAGRSLIDWPNAARRFADAIRDL